MHLPPFRRFWPLAALAALVHGYAFAEPSKVPTEAEHGIPLKKIDERILGKDAVDGASWWSTRLANGVCRKEVGTAYAEYKKAPSEATFATLSPLVEKCGRCATAPIVRKTERPNGKPERWYDSDGSCWIGDSPTLDASVKKIVQNLRTPRRYVKDNGGYRSVEAFFKTEPTGAKMPETDVAETASPFFAFIAVRGPTIVTPTIATYFVKNEFEAASENALWLWFRSQPRPEGLEKMALPEAELPVVQARGQWFVTEKGYFRYSTGADFGYTMPNLADTGARRILLEMLVETLAVGDMEP